MKKANLIPKTAKDIFVLLFALCAFIILMIMFHESKAQTTRTCFGTLTYDQYYRHSNPSEVAEAFFYERPDPDYVTITKSQFINAYRQLEGRNRMTEKEIEECIRHSSRKTISLSKYNEFRTSGFKASYYSKPKNSVLWDELRVLSPNEIRAHKNDLSIFKCEDPDCQYNGTWALGACWNLFDGGETATPGVNIGKEGSEGETGDETGTGTGGGNGNDNNESFWDNFWKPWMTDVMRFLFLALIAGMFYLLWRLFNNLKNLNTKKEQIAETKTPPQVVNEVKQDKIAIADKDTCQCSKHKRDVSCEPRHNTTSTKTVTPYERVDLTVYNTTTSFNQTGPPSTKT